MKRILTAAAVAASLLMSSPAFANIITANPSDQNGTNVLGPGPAETGAIVSGEIGNTGVLAYFTGTTTEVGSDDLRISGGQATVTGDLNLTTQQGGDTYLITALDIFSDPGNTYDWIELALFGTGSITFTLTDSFGALFNFDPITLGVGENRFAFQAIDGQSISNLNFTVADGGVDTVKQVRIGLASGVVPEPAVWAMMLIGFGAIGGAMRRRKARPAMQFA